jgi:S1-C subfamily serine protease
MTTVMELSNALAGAVDRAARSVLAVHGRPRLPSTGVLWRPGLIVTASHTVEQDRDVTLATPDGRTISAQVAGRDPGLDIAVLRGDVGETPVADVAADAELRIGHLVLALGAGPRASAGIVSALDARSGRSTAGDTLAVDLTLYPGFSGGPLIDVLGRVVGITTSGASRHLQYAIRSGAVTRLADHVAQRGRIPRAYLGVGTQPVALPEALRRRLGIEQPTAVIAVNVRADSPAAAAGLIIGDIIVGIGGEVVAEPEDLVAALRPERVGQALAVRILRGGEPRELRATIGERPQRT